MVIKGFMKSYLLSDATNMGLGDREPLCYTKWVET
jgi:hypothetical protein